MSQSDSKPQEIDMANSTRSGDGEPQLGADTLENVDEDADATHAFGHVEARRVLTELGYTERFIIANLGELLFVSGVGWHVYRDGVWVLDEVNDALERTKYLPRRLQEEMLDGKLLIDDNGFRSVLKQVSSMKTRRSVLNGAEVDSRIKVTPMSLNADPWALAVRNGLLNLRTSELRDLEPSDYVTFRANVAYDPDATDCPRFDAMLAHAFPAQPEMIAYIWRVLGYCLTGVNTAQAFFFLWGEKGTSKSTIGFTLKEMLGTYAIELDEQVLVGSENHHLTWATDLRDKRFIIKDEMSPREVNSARLNKLVSGEEIRARRMRENMITVRLGGKFMITTNPRPKMGSGDHDGIWRRIHPWEFKHQVPADAMIPDYHKVLAHDEGSAILNRAVAALRDCLTSDGGITPAGLRPPATVTAGVAEYRTADNTYGEFMDEYIEYTGDSSDAITNEDIVGRLTEWCGKRIKVPGPNQLADMLKGIGLVRMEKSARWTMRSQAGTSRVMRGWTHGRFINESDSLWRRK